MDSMKPDYRIVLLELKEWPSFVGPFASEQEARDFITFLPKDDGRPWAVVETTPIEGSCLSKITKLHELNLGWWQEAELATPQRPRQSWPPNNLS